MAVGVNCLVNQEQIMQQLQVALALHNQGEFDQPEAIYRQILAVDVNNFYALRFLGCLQSSKGCYQSAILLLRQAITVSPGDSECWFNLGNAYRQDNRFEEAIVAYRTAEECGSTNPQVFNNLGRCLQELFKEEESIPVLEKAVEIDSNCFGAWFALGNSWRCLGEVSRAAFCYKKSIDASPAFVDAYLTLGELLQDEGRAEEAIAIYRKAIEVKPNFADAYFCLGNLLKIEGEVDEAVSSYRKAVEINSCYEKGIGFLAIEFLASVLIALGRFEEADCAIELHGSSMGEGSFLHFLRFLSACSEGSYLEMIDLSNAIRSNELKYLLLRKLRSWICVGDYLEGVYNSLYVDMYEAFGIQWLDSTSEICVLKSCQGWRLPPCPSLTFRVYSSRFSVNSDSLKLSGPFSSDVNHLSHVGHFYLMLSSRFGGKVDLVGSRIEIRLDFEIDALPASNLCLGFSARVSNDWKRGERSHSYVELTEESEGLFIANVTSESLEELGLNEEHPTAKKYKLWDPVETAQHASGMFLFLRSPDSPVNPAGSVIIHSFNVI